MSIEVRVPVTGESVTEATVGLWLCQEGDAVAAGEPLVELETDKVNLEVAAERSGVLVKIARQVGEVVKPGEVLAYLEQAPAAETASQAADPSAPTATPTSRPHASPLASRIAQAHGVDLANVPGSGTAGRVTREDVERYLEASAPDAAAAPGQAAEASTAAPEPLPKPEQAPAGEGAAPEPHRRETRERMSRRRRTIAERLLEAQRTAAMLTTFAEADLAAVQELRARHREAFQQRHGVRLGLMSFFVRATVAALRAYPRLNAEIQGDEIVLKQYYDLGIAVAAPEGLVVPVLRDADRQSFAELEHEIVRLAQRVQDHSLTLDDLRGGTFTITNGGVFGSLLSTPILSPPQVGILGLHTIQERPVARGGQVVIRPMMYLALTYDHRIVDGAEAVQFLGRVRQLIEEPAALLLDL